MQTDIGMEYFDEQSENDSIGKNSLRKAQTNVQQKSQGKRSQMSMQSMKSGNKMNNDSSTAFGTQQLNHGQSLAVDIEPHNLIHNHSIEIGDEGKVSPGIRSTRMMKEIQEEDYYQEGHDKASSKKRTNNDSSPLKSHRGSDSPTNKLPSLAKKGSVNSGSPTHRKQSRFSKAPVYDDEDQSIQDMEEA